MAMPPVTADVNWLLSALAQASAAMIAIVGGLLVSRYVTLHAEQQAAGRRVADLTRREREAEARLADARAALGLYDIDDLLIDEDVFQVIIDKDLTPTVKDVLEAVDHDGENLNKELLTSRLEDLSADLGRAFKAIIPHVPESRSHPSWPEFRREHTFTVGNREAWQWAYDQICGFQRDKAKRREAEDLKKSNPFGSLLAGRDFGVDIDVLRNISLTGGVGGIAAQHELAHLAALRGRVDDADTEIRAIQQERRLAGETFEATRQPEGFGLALQVLSTLAVLGIAVPVVIMGFGVLDLPGWARGLVIGSFFAGIALLLRFLFVYASFLREGGRSTLPATIFGLFLRR